MTSIPSAFSGKAFWGFVAFSHGWTWFFWMVAALFGTTIWRPPALFFFILGGLGVLLGGVVMTRLMGGAVGLAVLARRITT